ncbi:uncharacterized protein LOC128892131 isoform X2 [Hylaeus anthracinus]|uniref:uncharacterized protein LOC128880967 isoform X2 n=1 Tax=Hylaeus volcanicus TaxID=313075 RepID=UPI0023B86F03|nr:uncharacterized protein LOC128880967 isoform X2 [Hylaeus volcanicus]XP_054008251.1 uncharacterized protein LOC128892131 isoform X2 [Hylaeus anthracinus]
MVSGWCPCVPLGRRESSAQQQTASSSRSIGNDGAPFTVSAATDHAEMVQMFYYENRGKCCKKLLRYNGYPNKVLLFPEEGWARSASSSYWTLTPFWWSRSRCKVVEVAGTRRGSRNAGSASRKDRLRDSSRRNELGQSMLARRTRGWRTGRASKGCFGWKFPL